MVGLVLGIVVGEDGGPEARGVDRAILIVGVPGEVGIAEAVIGLIEGGHQSVVRV